MRELPERKPNRLKNYDYSQNGAYFVTICVKDKKCILWESNVGANRVRPELSQIHPELSKTGIIVENEISRIAIVYANVKIDAYVIMPNHIHLIVVIQNGNDEIVNDDGRTRFAPTISRIIKQTKGLATKQIGYSIWQKSFYDHIIRDEADYKRIAEYMENNPVNWENDCFYGDTR